MQVSVSFMLWQWAPPLTETTLPSWRPIRKMSAPSPGPRLLGCWQNSSLQLPSWARSKPGRAGSAHSADHGARICSCDPPGFRSVTA